MCGIVGVAGALTGSHDDVLKSLLILDTIRGVDSTGIAAIDRNDDVRIAKTVGHTFDLFGQKVFDNAIARMNRAIIGHNRFATTGKVNKASAHPFDIGDIVGVHNGTLHSRHKLHDNQYFTVDSENLYHHMNEKGLDNLLEVLDGAWSLVWWNKADETLNFLRNKERPMWMCEEKTSGVIFWASEPWMLDVAIGRKTNLDCTDPVSTKTDTLYTFHINKMGKVEKPIVREAASKVVSYQGYQGNFQGGQNSLAGAKTAHIQHQQTQASNIITFSKKNKEVQGPKRLANASTNLYAGRKDVLVEALALISDRHGSQYISCFDPDNRAAHIRLYMKRGDKPETMVGKELLVTVGKKFADDREGMYYKVEHGSVKLSPNEVEANNEGDDSNGRYFHDCRGKLIPKKEWEDTYGTCAMCTGYVNPTLKHLFTKGGGALCNECSVDEEMLRYVSLIH